MRQLFAGRRARVWLRESENVCQVVCTAWRVITIIKSRRRRIGSIGEAGQEKDTPSESSTCLFRAVVFSPRAASTLLIGPR